MSREETIAQLVESLKGRRGALLSALQRTMSGGRNRQVGESESVRAALGSKFHLAEADSQELARIDAALLRHRKKSFGVCKSCEKDIPVARLRAVPHAERCVACQEKVDDGETDDEPGSDFVSIDMSTLPDFFSV